VKRKLRKVTAHKRASYWIFRAMFGRRCTRCSFPVEERDAVFYELVGLSHEFILLHRGCKP
jgi:hypothetical protein